jgi:TIR domain
MAGVFISYRREDSQSAAGRLADHFETHLTGVSIFRDVDTIEPGIDFVEAIEGAIRASDVMLVVIGPRWLTMTNANGTRRLDDPSDYHRQEISHALSLNKFVIPVLVDGARMPEGRDLPEELQKLNLARRNAHELSDRRWNYDVSELAKAIRKRLGLPELTHTKRNWRFVPGFAILAILISAGAIWMGRLNDNSKVATVYNYPAGSYRQEGGKWHEYHNDRLYASFEKYDQDSEYIYLVDKSRNRIDTSRNPPEIREFWVRLPIRGGDAQWSYSNPFVWTSMYRVKPANQ